MTESGSIQRCPECGELVQNLDLNDTYLHYDGFTYRNISHPLSGGGHLNHVVGKPLDIPRRDFRS